MNARLENYGERAVLARGLGPGPRATIRAALRTAPPVDLEEAVEGHDCVLFIFRDPIAPALVRRWLSALEQPQGGPAAGRLHRIAVVYDGPDLDPVADRLGVDREAVIRMHAASTYTVRFMGFMPGFPYLEGLDPQLQIPRRDSPRNRIEPGSVAIGGPHAGIYTVASPGGWHLLGRTEALLFDPAAARRASPDPRQVFRFRPGDRVRFQPEGSC